MLNSAPVVAPDRALLAEFERLKHNRPFESGYQFALQLPENGGRLIPVGEADEGNDALLAQFSHWRAENFFAFPTQFPVTQEGTARWLRNGLLNVPDRLLFLVEAPDGTLVGHLGYASCNGVPLTMEIDNVVRGVKAGYPGIMQAALGTLIEWAEAAFAPHVIHLRVFSHNDHAVRFYERCGFVREALLPLRRTENDGRVTFAPVAAGDAQPADAFFQRMVWSAAPPARQP